MQERQRRELRWFTDLLRVCHLGCSLEYVRVEIDIQHALIYLDT